MNQQPHSAAPDPTLVFETLTAHQRTAALLAAIEIGLYRAIGEGVHDATTLAARCNASERGIRILCDYLVVIGLLGKADGKFVHTPTTAMFLDPASPTSLAPMARFLGGPALQEPFRQLTEIVRTGRTVLHGQGTVEPENPVWVEFAHSMAPMMAPMAAPLAAVVLARPRRPRAGARHRRRSRPVRHRSGETEPRCTDRGGRLGARPRSRLSQRPQSRRRRSLSDARQGAPSTSTSAGPTMPSCSRIFCTISTGRRAWGC